jgi:Insertion element 4 transposase N-terminal/Transposase DDE domain
MVRAVVEIPSGTRATDHINLGAIAEYFPLEKVTAILAKSGRASRRQRQLPAHVAVYYVIALALLMEYSCREVLRCLLEGLKWFAPVAGHVRTTGKSGISQARTRLGSAPLEQLHDEIVRPIASERTRGAWYRQWKLTSLDGSTLDVADTDANEEAFGRPGASRGKSGFPQIRFVSLVENGTHVLFGSRMGGCRIGEATLTERAISALTKGMLCLGDRNFFGYEAWKRAAGTGADLLWRVKRNLILHCRQRLADGSYLSTIYPSPRHRQRDQEGIEVRVIEYRLVGIPDAEPLYRLVTTILDPEAAPAEELAALYHERWEIETALDELKTHLRGRKIVLRSKTPDLVRQEFYGLLLAHFAVRGLMHEAALKGDVDPDVLSFVHAVRVIRRKLPQFVAIADAAKKRLHDSVLEELLEERVSSSRGRRNMRAVKQKVGKFPIRRRSSSSPAEGRPQPRIEVAK